jgi:hypothetical protein
MLHTFSIILLLLAMLSSYAGEFSGTLRVIPEYHRANQDGGWINQILAFFSLRFH